MTNLSNRRGQTTCFLRNALRSLAEAIRPFLYNLFSDPAIIRLPVSLRLPLARLIARQRVPVARDI